MKKDYTPLVISVILIGYAIFAYDYSLIGKLMAAAGIAGIVIYVFIDSRKPHNKNKKG